MPRELLWIESNATSRTRLFLDLARPGRTAGWCGSDPTVEPLQLFVGEAEIGLADGEQLAASSRPAAERVIVNR